MNSPIIQPSFYKQFEWYTWLITLFYFSISLIVSEHSEFKNVGSICIATFYGLHLFTSFVASLSDFKRVEIQHIAPQIMNNWFHAHAIITTAFTVCLFFTFYLSCSFPLPCDTKKCFVERKKWLYFIICWFALLLSIVIPSATIALFTTISSSEETRRFSNENSPSYFTQTTTDTTCTICLDDATKKQRVSLKCCAHVFHGLCIKKWMEMGKNTCPNCRMEIRTRKTV